MRNVFDVSANEKSTIERSNFVNSILKSPTPKINSFILSIFARPTTVNVATAVQMFTLNGLGLFAINAFQTNQLHLPRLKKRF